MTDPLEKPLSRNLFFSKQVDQETINSLTRSIIEIREHDEYLKKFYDLHGLTYIPKPIIIHIDSYGGSVYQCFGLLSIMKAKGTPVNTVITGCAMSCGFMIAIHGAHRQIHKYGTMMYHQVSFGAHGTVADMEEGVYEAKRLQKMIEKMTLENTKITKEKLEKVYKKKHDWYLDPKDALKWGCVDEIVV
jgi:ATP-dependent Clp protease protease subunit